MYLHIQNPAPPKILKMMLDFGGLVGMEKNEGQKFLPHFCPGAKMRAKINFTSIKRAKMDTSRLGYICIIYTQTGRPIFAIGRIEQLDLCPVFAAYLPSVFKFLPDFCLQKNY